MGPRIVVGGAWAHAPPNKERSVYKTGAGIFSNPFGYQHLLTSQETQRLIVVRGFEPSAPEWAGTKCWLRSSSMQNSKPGWLNFLF